MAAAGATADINVEEKLLKGRNERGIPLVRFIVSLCARRTRLARRSTPAAGADAALATPAGCPQDDVAGFLSDELNGVASETVIGAYTTLLSKFRTYEVNLMQQRMKAKLRVPEIEKTMELIEKLKKTQEEEGEASTLDAHYNLSDVLYARAEVSCSGKVCLWLGANVMVEYSYEEAAAWLTTHLEQAKQRIATTQEDLEHLRSQKIMTEVAIARVYNHDLKERRQHKEQGP